MDIVFCIDNNYVMPCGIAMTSLLENNKEDDIVVHIVGMNLTEVNRGILQEIANQYRTSLNYYTVDEGYLKKFNLSMNGPKHITLASYIRLFLSEILPDNINKVLYLDCDLIVNGKVTELYNIDLDGYSLAGVIDTLSFIPETYQRLKYSSIYPYINAGVLLINLRYWRDNNLLVQFLSYMNTNFDQIILHDQDTLNGVLYDSILLCPLKYNMHSSLYLKKWNLKEYKTELDDARRNPVVIHYTTGHKPWIKGLLHPMAKEYRRYMNMTAWGDAAMCWGSNPLKYKIRYYKRKILYSLNLSKSKYITLP